MKKEETIVKQYLESQRYKSIIFEPDGNVPPDFLVDKTIAIEVRRLNQSYQNNGSLKGLEEDSIPFYNTVNKLLNEYNSNYIDKSYFVSLRFRRPIDLKTPRKTKEEIKKALSHYINSPKREKIEISINENLALVMSPVTPQEGRFFIMGTYSDQDSGGFVLSEMEKNILICSKEKIDKVKDVRLKYGVWWLALVDLISYGISEDEKKALNSELLKDFNWDKVVIVNPLKPEQGYEI